MRGETPAALRRDLCWGDGVARLRGPSGEDDGSAFFFSPWLRIRLKVGGLLPVCWETSSSEAASASSTRPTVLGESTRANGGRAGKALCALLLLISDRERSKEICRTIACMSVLMGDGKWPIEGGWQSSAKASSIISVGADRLIAVAAVRKRSLKRRAPVDGPGREVARGSRENEVLF